MKNLFDFDYNNSIVSAVSSILKYYNVESRHQSLPFLDEKLQNKRKNIVLILLDGMGVDLIGKNLEKNSFIRKHINKQIYSVFPPTTAAATISWHSGLTPWETGWIGWMCYYPQYNEFVENFTNTAYYGKEKLNSPTPAKGILKYETIYEKIVRKNPQIEYHKIFPDFEENGAKSFEEMCERIKNAVNGNDKSKIISAYWTEPDHSVHQLGTTAPEVGGILKKLDNELENLCNQLNNSLIIISADHGETDIEEIHLNLYDKLCDTFIRPPALESRFITFFIKSEETQIFLTEFNKFFSKDFRLYTKEEFMQSGLLGTGIIHSQIHHFLGDFIAISTGNKSLRYTAGGNEFSPLKATHAGISAEEMIIPLIIIEKD